MTTLLDLFDYFKDSDLIGHASGKDFVNPFYVVICENEINDALKYNYKECLKGLGK